MIPVIGFATLSKFDLADRLLASIDHPVQDLVVINNSGTKQWTPTKPDSVKNLWHIEVPYGLGANGAWNLIIKATPHAPYWVLPNDDSHFEPGALEKIEAEVDTEAFNFVKVNPKWSCVVPGEGAIKQAGLWDEVFYPIYYDDDDYERRMIHHGVKFNDIDAVVHHDNSSTLRSGYEDKNKYTFNRNQRAYIKKCENNDYSVHGWDIDTRRANSWD